ncbi:tyrosine-type recombinase/integrase, partial [Streptosporangium canum]|uniref:tyrosine-type recombinase/integrase n=1 Tax=Streptosporangium canum TaxID=324952 RepID=UPI0037B94C4E
STTYFHRHLPLNLQKQDHAEINSYTTPLDVTDDTREIPIPPVLVETLREHIEKHGAERDGRLFRTSKGRPFSSSAYSAVWQETRRLVFTVEQIASPLGARPYDLRHAAVSLWLNAGVPPTEVAQRAGHGVDVLLCVYAKCIEGQRAHVNGQITKALET